MIRGFYTGASAMAARITQMDVVANNLANVNTSAFKRDETLFKSFPEMLIRRLDDDGVLSFPPGSIDRAPVVGRLGTGVEVNEVYTEHTQGTLNKTENPFDLALEGSGFFSIETPNGIRYTRNGAFSLEKNGLLVTREGYPVLGEKGHIHLKENNYFIMEDGRVFINSALQNPEQRPVQLNENGFEESQLVDRIKLTDFPFVRYLEKEGNSFYRSTEEAGEPRFSDPSKTKILTGFLEVSNVNAVREMVTMIEVQRAYEASQKSVTTHDGALDRLINQMAAV